MHKIAKLVKASKQTIINTQKHIIYNIIAPIDTTIQPKPPNNQSKLNHKTKTPNQRTKPKTNQQTINKTPNLPTSKQSKQQTNKTTKIKHK